MSKAPTQLDTEFGSALVGWRVFAAAVAVIAGIGGLLWLSTQLQPSGLGFVAQLAAGGLIMLIAASVFEWLVHRYIYHSAVIPGLRRIHVIHEQGHHRSIFPTWRYTTHGMPNRHPIVSTSATDLHRSSLANFAVKLAHFSWYLALGAVCVWAPSWLMTRQPGVLYGQIAVTLIIADLFVRVHDAIHYPETNRVLRTQAWFKFLARHHYIHHVDTSSNVNFLLPLGDLLLGTLRRTLTEHEVSRHGSMEEATAAPIGHSEPAIQVAVPRARRGTA
jgi:hypothetical protein